MSLISHLQCIRCGAEYPADTIMNLCPADDSPVEIIMDLERLAAEQPGQSWYRPGDKVVAFNTGSLEKYLPDLRHLL
jgi:threonine synthase